jgi:hypothetical protein
MSERESRSPWRKSNSRRAALAKHFSVQTKTRPQGDRIVAFYLHRSY